MLNRVIITLTGLLLSSVLAAVEPVSTALIGQQRGPLSFETFDVNADGFVTRQEHAYVHAQRMSWRAEHGYPMRNAGRAPTFQQMDADNDGLLNRTEMHRWQIQQRQQHAGPGRNW
jgi:hypothetical protein